MGNKSIRVVLLGTLFVLAAAMASAQVNVSIGFFHDTLAPHGRWVATSSYGDCWAPSGVAAGWAPYVDGEWQWTDYGWTWASSDPWGDVAYHYGTWVWSPPYGWVWVPGTVWAPSWVTWAYTDDYIGWAPVPVSFAVTSVGYAGPPVVVSRSSFVFVPSRQFAGVPVASVRVPVAQTSAIYARAQRATAFPVQGGIVHNTGLPIARVEKATGRRIEAVRAPERLHAAPIPQGKSASYRVVAPKAERAAAIRKAGGPQNEPNAAHASAKRVPAESRAAHEQNPSSKAKREPAPARPAPTESQARHEAKPKSQPVEARPAQTEPQARHEAKPKKEHAQPHPAPSEPQARAHEAKPRQEQAERPPARPQAGPGEAQAQPAHPQPKPAAREAQHGNPHGNAQPQHGNPQPQHDKDKDGPGRPNDR